MVFSKINLRKYLVNSDLSATSTITFLLTGETIIKTESTHQLEFESD